MKKITILFPLLMALGFLTACTTSGDTASQGTEGYEFVAPPPPPPPPPASAQKTAEPAPESPDTNTPIIWQLLAIESADGQQQQQLDPVPSLAIGPGQLEGDVGCYGYRIPIQLAPDDTFTLGETEETEDTVCADTIPILNTYLDALEQMSRITASPTQLVLSDETGALEMIFAPAE